MATEYFTVPDNTSPLEHRADQLEQYGARAYDMVVSAWACEACKLAVGGPPAMILPVVNYRLPADLEEWVVEAGAGAVEDAEIPCCEECGENAELGHIDYFAHHSAMKVDLVVRWSPAAGAQILRWSPSLGFGPMPAMSEDEERLFVRDALLRGASAARDRDAGEEADAILLEAAEGMPGESEWLDFLPWLSGREKFSVAAAIATGHAEAHPEDPEGHFWLGQITVDLVARKIWGEEKLGEAEAHFERALACQPHHPFALLGLANVARVRGDLAAARRHLENLLARTPDHAEGLYTLALIELDGNPGRALALFEQGAARRPRDADYLRGMGRALLALGHPLEAQVAAFRAKQLAPRDERIDELLLAALAAVKG
jgi:tetratricopeptide (TPR) repeat protein